MDVRNLNFENEQFDWVFSATCPQGITDRTQLTSH